MNGWHKLPAMVALLLALAPRAARGEDRLPVHLCGLTSADEVTAALRLDDILATATLVPADPAACVGEAAAVRAMLVDRAPGKVTILLDGPKMALERQVPWLATAHDGFSRLDRSGRLASFAILLEALLAEYRLTAAAQGFAPDGTPLPPPVAAVAPAPPAPPARREHKRGTAPRPAEPEARVEPDPAPAPEPPAPAAKPAPVPAAAARAPIAGAVGPEGPGEPVPYSTGSGPEVVVGIRFREPEAVGVEYGVGLRLGAAFAVARFQPETTWTLERRPLAVSAVGIELGWLHPLWPRRDLRISGRIAVLAEQLKVRQLDLDAAQGSNHEALDVGAALGVVVDRRINGGLWATLGAEGIWEPTAGDLRAPPEEEADWSRRQFNGVGARATLAISWRP